MEKVQVPEGVTNASYKNKELTKQQLQSLKTDKVCFDLHPANYRFQRQVTLTFKVYRTVTFSMRRPRVLDTACASTDSVLETHTRDRVPVEVKRKVTLEGYTVWDESSSKIKYAMYLVDDTQQSSGNYTRRHICVPCLRITIKPSCGVHLRAVNLFQVVSIFITFPASRRHLLRPWV